MRPSNSALRSDREGKNSSGEPAPSLHTPAQLAPPPRPGRLRGSRGERSRRRLRLRDLQPGSTLTAQVRRCLGLCFGHHALPCLALLGPLCQTHHLGFVSRVRLHEQFSCALNPLRLPSPWPASDCGGVPMAIAEGKHPCRARTGADCGFGCGAGFGGSALASSNACAGSGGRGVRSGPSRRRAE